MELRPYLQPLVRWWWLLVAAALLAGVSSYMLMNSQPVAYESTATLMIGRTIFDPNPTNFGFGISQQLAQTYVEFTQLEPVKAEVKRELGLEELPDYSARVLPNTQFIELRVVDTVPARAQAVADSLANQLLQLSPTGAFTEEQERIVFIESQLTFLEDAIEATQLEIADMQKLIGELDSALELAEAERRLNGLQTKLATLQTNYASLLANSQQGAVNTLTIIEPASLPIFPIGPSLPLIVFMAMVLGVSLAAGAAYLLEYLDDSFREPEEVEITLGVPVIGYTPEVRPKGPSGVDQSPLLHVGQHSPLLWDAYRMLYTRLEFAARARGLGNLKSVLITSPAPADGKTTLAINLAIVAAQDEKKVVLVDADLRRPAIHRFLEIDQTPGLTDVLLQPGKDPHMGLREVDGTKLSVVTSGSAADVESIGTSRMAQVVTRLTRKGDLVILDSPPLALPETLALAATVDAVILVARLGATSSKETERLADLLERAGATFIGVVLNKVSKSMALSFGGPRGYSAYYHTPDGRGAVPEASTDIVEENGVSGSKEAPRKEESSTKK